jgi:rieske iron-sulfur protein
MKVKAATTSPAMMFFIFAVGRFGARGRGGRGCQAAGAGRSLRVSYRSKKGQVVRAEDLALGDPQMQAYPMAPDGTVRSDSRLNLVILARFDPAALTDETRTRAGDGVVTYSAICTHQACPVNMWKERQHVRLLLPRLHLRSQKRRRGDRWAGSAPRPLAALGLKLKDGVVVVASTFSGRVGGTQS